MSSTQKSTTLEAPAPAPAPVSAKKTAVTRRKLAASKAPARQRTLPNAAPPALKKVKQRLVRDSFTMPSTDFALIDQLKARAIGFKRPAKKSELLRAGLQALTLLSDAKLRSVLDGLTPVKAGRPKKSGA